MNNFREQVNALTNALDEVILDKGPVIKLALTAVLSGGHVLLEDVPGVAKTMLARTLAVASGCAFNRIQCTPDLLPSDITGVSIYNPKTQEFSFREGPVFSQILVADEINRATPRTQSAL
ncbi:MAG TPA: AAA family ATPase, partial [Candidatus Hydrogenedentes bacterium]|nr:AAA family ATPase [Candidatus Hydrogenedentota bacterium]